MGKRVLVVADIEDDDRLSLEKARDIAVPLQASIEIVKFIHPTEQSGLSDVQRVAQNSQLLSSMITQIFDETTRVSHSVVISEHIADWVVNRCSETPIDLVIKSGHRSESLFHQPSDWTLIRHLSCPILLVNHDKWNSQSNILLTLDVATKESQHQQLNALMLNWGKFWHQAIQTKLHAVYSIPVNKALLELEVVDKNLVMKKKAPAAKQAMQALLAEFEMDSVHCHIAVGPAEKTIPHLANELHSDLVIIGSVGREGVSGFVLGNTAEKVIHNLRTDCLVVKIAS
jgi:universal stress protein E